LLASPLARLVIDPVRVISGLRFVDATAARGLLIDDPDAREGERFARAMGVKLAVDDREMARIPKNGPLIVVSNHPFGFLDAASVCWLLDRQRSDVRFIANRMLQSSSLARSRCFFVDAFGADRSGNARALRDAMAWVAAGKCLAVFPAGEVMSTPAGSSEPVEAAWNPIIARIVEKTMATVLPRWSHSSLAPHGTAPVRVAPSPRQQRSHLHRSSHSAPVLGTPRAARSTDRVPPRTRRTRRCRSLRSAGDAAHDRSNSKPADRSAA
jgi:hypothetical protein